MSGFERQRSFWGWGYWDRFPSEEARKSLVEQISTLLTFEGLHPRPLPRMEDIDLPPPRIREPARLEHIIGRSRDERVMHTYGKSYRDIVRAFRLQLEHPPDLVAHPESEEDVERILDWAGGANVAVTPFGGGTSVVGGVESPPDARFSGALSLDMRRMGRVLDVDRVSRLARIQAGALGPDLESELRAHHLTLRHFPQSFEHSTLGGWIATRAGGHYATLYTHIDDLVASIRMMTPTGVFATHTLPASGAGPSPDRMVLGSEGILGVITEAVVRLHEHPSFRAKASVHFRSFREGASAARALAQSGLYPTNCRLLDGDEALLSGVALDGSSVLMIAFESSDHPLEAWIERAIAIAAGYGGVCPNGPRLTYADRSRAEAGTRSADELWKSVFLEAPYLQSALVSLGVLVDTFETACTWARFEALHQDVIESVGDAMRQVAGKGRVTCRLTHVYPDGPAPYYTFIAPAREGGEIEQWSEIKAAASEALLRHGATITHHHAVGRTHRPWYDRERPEPFAAALRAVKATLDPKGILNPGVLIDPGPAWYPERAGR
jgi:alkyldihydroxyacetonephosphate synthase